ncbi:MAG: hypothetical protein ACJA1S_001674 [Cellvibrionaceae bacterium]|jgi:hypothetical protein
MISPSVELSSLYTQNCLFYNNQKKTSQIQALCPTGSRELEKCKSFYCSCKKPASMLQGALSQRPVDLSHYFYQLIAITEGD